MTMLRILPVEGDMDCVAMPIAAPEGRAEGVSSLPLGAGNIRALPLPQADFYRPGHRIPSRRSTLRRMLRRCLRTALSMVLLAPVTLGVENNIPFCDAYRLMTRDEFQGYIDHPRAGAKYLRPPCAVVYDPERSRVL